MVYQTYRNNFINTFICTCKTEDVVLAVLVRMSHATLAVIPRLKVNILIKIDERLRSTKTSTN